MADPHEAICGMFCFPFRKLCNIGNQFLSEIKGLH